jgi:hypothetical protein
MRRNGQVHQVEHPEVFHADIEAVTNGGDNVLYGLGGTDKLLNETGYVKDSLSVLRDYFCHVL